jgi:glutamine---fructose-6-phosphate transaminase (isomerizing)
MCGIVGAVAQRNVLDILLTGLKRLEYRGYDSAGVALLSETGELNRLRALGKVAELESALAKEPIKGHVGIAHTRWATHGVPAQKNAHPHMSGVEIALVHNGIIENHQALRVRLEKAGYTFESETDTEVIVHLLHFHLQQESDLAKAVFNAVAELEGAYALGIIDKNQPDRLVAVRQGSPLVVGLGIGEHFIASDCLALLPVTQQFVFLEEGDLADVRCDQFQLYDNQFKPVERAIHQSSLNHDATDKGQFRHFMRKEIFEQAAAIGETLEGRLSHDAVLEQAFGLKAESVFSKVEHIQIVACGTSYHAGLVAKYWLESIAGVSCSVDIASEIRYRKAVVRPNTLFVSISQSGETADTLAALKQAKTIEHYISSLVICNVPESSLVRASELVFMTRAGVEVGVASTKAFTTQLCALLMLTIAVGKHHRLDVETESYLVKQLKALPGQVKAALDIDGEIETLAKQFIEKHHTLFLGRGSQFPIALEGALKLKEISYIHAEAYPAGELKHGPLALVDDHMPVVVTMANDAVVDKVKSNIEEVLTRGGQVFIFADEAIKFKADRNVIKIPTTDPVTAPIVFTIPLQLLAYHVAVFKGTDVDQPRNLAKSVTVE